MYTQRRHRTWCLCASVFVALVSLIVVTVAMPSTVAFGDGEVVPNEIIVVYNDDVVPTSQIDTQMEMRGYDVVDQIESVSAQGTIALPMFRKARA